MLPAAAAGRLWRAALAGLTTGAVVWVFEVRRRGKDGEDVGG